MTSSTSLPRPPATSEPGSAIPRRPKSDLELAAEAWRFVSRQVQRVRDRRAMKAAAAAAAAAVGAGGLDGKGSNQEGDDAGSVLSEAVTVVECVAGGEGMREGEKMGF